MNFLELRDDADNTEKTPPPSTTSTRDAVESAIERAKGDRKRSWDEVVSNHQLPKRDSNVKPKKVAMNWLPE